MSTIRLNVLSTVIASTRVTHYKCMIDIADKLLFVVVVQFTLLCTTCSMCYNESCSLYRLFMCMYVTFINVISLYSYYFYSYYYILLYI
jgi:hypothetical protein